MMNVVPGTQKHRDEVGPLPPWENQQDCGGLPFPLYQAARWTERCGVLGSRHGCRVRAPTTSLGAHTAMLLIPNLDLVMLQVAELCKLNPKPCQVSQEWDRMVSRKDEGLRAALDLEKV